MQKEPHQDGLRGIPELWASVRTGFCEGAKNSRDFILGPPGGTPEGKKKRPLKSKAKREKAARDVAESLRERLSSRRTFSVMLATAIPWLLLTVMLDCLDPFGLGRATSKFSEAVVARVEAPFYRSDAQDHIAVVLIDEHTLKQRGLQWPPQYSYYENLAYSLLTAKPRAVFFDFLLEEKRLMDGSLDSARSALAEDLEQARVPLFIAQSVPGKPNVFSEVPGVQSVVAAWVNVGSAYPLLLTPTQTADHAAERADAQPESEQALQQSHLTTAYRLYQVACRDGAAGCAGPAFEPSTGLAERPLKVQWGGLAPPQAKALGHGWSEDCITAAASSGARAKAAVFAFFQAAASGLYPRLEDGGRRTCPHILTLKEEELDDPAIAALLKDRVVMVGAQLDGIQDVVVTPVNGQLPGIYLHAMALDNLMRWGKAYPYSSPYDALMLQAFAGFAIAYLAAVYLRGRPFRYRTGLFVIFFTVLAVTIALCRALGCQTGFNWFAMLVMLEITAHYEKRIEEKEQKASTTSR